MGCWGGEVGGIDVLILSQFVFLFRRKEAEGSITLTTLNSSISPYCFRA